MPKTVNVVDEAGNRYEATYQKRAQGLVKKGRARFIDENTICLSCPPNQNDLISEEITMENTVKHIEETATTTENTEETAFILPETGDPECINFCNEHNLNYCLKKIDEIGSDSESIITAVKAIASLDVVMTPVGSSAEDQAKAIADIIRKREETNQKKIDFYRDMINRILPPQKDEKAETERRKQYLGWISETLIESGKEYEISDLVKLYREFQ